jgi:hypothetical protein
MTAKKGSTKADGRRKAAKVRDLTSQTLSSAIGDAVKSLGDSLSTAARKG